MIIQVSIIIVNYNTHALTLQCVDSVIRQTSKDLLYEIIVVDNASTDGSQEVLAKVQGIKLICSDKNIGFGKGNNLGAKHASGALLFLLNSDTILIEDSIRILHDFFITHEQDLQIGTLGCTLVDKDLNPNGSSFNYATVNNVIRANMEVITSKFIRTKPKPIREEIVTGTYKEVGYVIGADLMVRKTIYVQENGFDEAFFMYFEEAELQKRIQKRGLKSYIYTETRIIHLEGGSTTTGKLTNKRRIMIQQGRNLFLKKSEPGRYTYYVVFDFFYSLLRVFNRNYTWEENIKFLKENIKSY